MRTNIIKASDIARCPIGSLSPSHYNDDGTCRCARKDQAEGVQPEPIIVVVESGMVSFVGIAGEAERPVVVIDYDTEGLDDNDVTVVPQASGQLARAAVSDLSTEEPSPEMANFAQRFVEGGDDD